VVLATGAVGDPKVPAYAAGSTRASRRSTDEHGVPLHERGVVRGEPGMYVLGLPFIHTLTSACTGGVGRDAEYVARQVEARSAIESAREHSVEYAARAA
jgi:hypothetical protein